MNSLIKHGYVFLDSLPRINMLSYIYVIGSVEYVTIVSAHASICSATVPDVLSVVNHHVRIWSSKYPVHLVWHNSKTWIVQLCALNIPLHVLSGTILDRECARKWNEGKNALPQH
jgi:hypothetical protein